MQLGLNCLYALSEGLRDSGTVKAAFELRLMSIEGYAPGEEFCPVCGRADIQDPVFSPAEGQVVCRACRKSGGGLPARPRGRSSAAPAARAAAGCR